jgi:signal transduction histidine kinase
MESQRKSFLTVLKPRWQLPVFLCLITAVAIIIDELVVFPVQQPFLRWVYLVSLIALIFLASFWINSQQPRWINPLQDQCDEHKQVMDAIIDSTLDIVSELDEQKTLQNIAQRAAELVEASFASVFLYDEKEDAMRLVTQTPYWLDLTGNSFKKGVGVVGVAFETGKPIIVNGYQAWDRRIPISLLPLDAFVGVPLIWKGQVIGALSIGDEMSRRTFNETDVERLQPFADLASIAIINSRMYSEMKRLSLELEQRNADKSVQLALTREELLHKTIQLQGLLKRLISAQESERSRISHDMHDSTTQLILAAVYATQAVMNGMEANPSQAKVQLQTVQMLLHQIEIEIRETIRNLRPIILDQEGVSVAIKQYLDRLSVIKNIKCTFSIEGTPTRLPEEFEVTIYRFIQEALQNVTMHSQAKKVSVIIQFLETNVLVTVQDDGVGFVLSHETYQDPNHFGLAGMQERAESIGSRLRVNSQPGVGTCVELDVPRPG